MLRREFIQPFSPSVSKVLLEHESSPLYLKAKPKSTLPPSTNEFIRQTGGVPRLMFHFFLTNEPFQDWVDALEDGLYSVSLKQFLQRGENHLPDTDTLNARLSNINSLFNEQLPFSDASKILYDHGLVKRISDRLVLPISGNALLSIYFILRRCSFVGLEHCCIYLMCFSATAASALHFLYSKFTTKYGPAVSSSPDGSSRLIFQNQIISSIRAPGSPRYQPLSSGLSIPPSAVDLSSIPLLSATVTRTFRNLPDFLNSLARHPTKTVLWLPTSQTNEFAFALVPPSSSPTLRIVFGEISITDPRNVSRLKKVDKLMSLLSPLGADSQVERFHRSLHTHFSASNTRTVSYTHPIDPTQPSHIPYAVYHTHTCLTSIYPIFFILKVRIISQLY